MDKPAPSFIAYNRPSIGQREMDEVRAVLESGWLTTGPRTVQFEQDFRVYCGAAYSLGVSSCTVGLHLALTALELGPRDEVITTPLTFCSTVNAILHTGATPVLADVGPDGNIDPASVASRLTARTKALLPVHYAGFPCEMEEVWTLAKAHGLAVVEDAAHAAGTLYRGKQIGSGPSDVVAFSFYATKNMTTGEGGMLTTPRAGLHERMKVLSLHGMSKDAWKRYSKEGSWFYDVVAPGYKYNLSDLQSALGIAQLKRLDEMNAIRTRYADLFNQAFSNVRELEIPFDDPQRGRHAWHIYPLKLNLQQLTIDRAQFIEELRVRGVGSTVHFIPIPVHSYYAQQEWANRHPCPGAMEVWPRLLSLPLYPAMTEEEVLRVIDTVKDIVFEHRVRTMVRVAAAAHG